MKLEGWAPQMLGSGAHPWSILPPRRGKVFQLHLNSQGALRNLPADVTGDVPDSPQIRLDGLQPFQRSMVSQEHGLPDRSLHGYFRIRLGAADHHQH